MPALALRTHYWTGKFDECRLGSLASIDVRKTSKPSLAKRGPKAASI